MTDVQQGSKTPDGGDSECQQEGHAGDSARHITFAPALEHGDESNDE
jgi:hypothetical protein